MRKTVIGASLFVCLVASRGEAQFSLLHAHRYDPAEPTTALASDGAGNLYGTSISGSGHLFRVRDDGTGFTILHAFAGDVDGQQPSSALVLESGFLYGTTLYGGPSARGVVFRLRTDGTGYTVLHAFAGGTNDGDEPFGKLASDGLGNLYGTTFYGGSLGSGVVFKLRTDGSGFSLLYSFTSGEYSPFGSLVLASDGRLYGTTGAGAFNLAARVFRLGTDGNGFTILHSFIGGLSDGGGRVSPLITDGAGNLYGTAETGGASNQGAVFKLTTDGSSFELLHSFVDPDGSKPFTALFLDGSGNLYGTTPSGTTRGTIFTLKTDGGGFAVLHRFLGGSGGEGSNPQASVIADSSGNLYGTTYGGGSSYAGTVFRLNGNGTGLVTLHHFGANGTAPEGGAPGESLVADGTGALYGTTTTGGTTYRGVVFKVNADGTGYTVLHFFAGAPSDGSAYEIIGGPGPAPSYAGALVVDGAGYLYGTTLWGGAANLGVVFKMKTDGSDFTLLRSFSGGSTDGASPQGSLAGDGAGYLYGTTGGGGANGRGVVFKMRTDGSGFEILHSFAGHTGDGSPFTGVTLAGAGKLYGAANGDPNEGVVFSLRTDGSDFEVLHTFTGADGRWPSRPVLDASTQTLYGTTQNGGGFGGAGVLYKMNVNGSDFSILHAFTVDTSSGYAVAREGAYPEAPPTLDGAGNIYGTAHWGGDYGDGGVVYGLRTDGSGFTVVHSFRGYSTAGDGGHPDAALIVDEEGKLFGTTSAGGPSNLGTEFVIRPIPAAASSNSPLCAGETLRLSAASVAGATYHWTGPDVFVSDEQNPTIPSASTFATGPYSLRVTAGSCTSIPATISVVVSGDAAGPTVVAPPAATFVQTACE